MTKPRVAKDYDKLDQEVAEQIKLFYPLGFAKHLITYKDKDGRSVSALPFETEEKYYLVRMTKTEAREIIEYDEDYDDDGELKAAVRAEYEDKYDDSEDVEVELEDDLGDDEPVDYQPEPSDD